MNGGRLISDSQMTNLFREFVFIVCYRIRLAVAVAGIVFTIAFLAALFLPSMYESSSKFLVTMPSNLDPLSRKVEYDSQYSVIRFLQNQKELIFSNRVLGGSCRELNGITEGEEYESLKCIENLSKNLSVDPPQGESFEGTNVFFISYEAKSKEEAYNTVDVVTRTYLKVYQDISQSKTNYSYGFFKGQVKSLRTEMQERGRELRTYETENAADLVDILNLEPGKTNIEVGPKALLTEALRQKQNLDAELIALRVVIEGLEAEAEKDGIPAMLPDMEVTGRAVTVYKNKVAQLSLQVSEMKTHFTSDFEPLQQLEQELEKSVQLLRDEIRLYVVARKIEAKSMQSTLDGLDKVITDLRENIQKTTRKKSEYEALRQDYMLATDSYIEANNQLEQARLANSLSYEEQYITLVDEPIMPKNSYKPKRKLIVIFGFFAALFVGVATVLLLDFMDHSIKTPEDIERYIGVAYLGSVPNQQ